MAAAWFPDGAPIDADSAAPFPHFSASYADGFGCRWDAARWSWVPPSALEALAARWGRALADGGEIWGGGRWTVGGWGVVVVRRACEGEAAVTSCDGGRLDLSNRQPDPTTQPSLLPTPLGNLHHQNAHKYPRLWARNHFQTMEQSAPCGCPGIHTPP